MPQQQTYVGHRAMPIGDINERIAAELVIPLKPEA
jgi:hypothetical protein